MYLLFKSHVNKFLFLGYKIRYNFEKVIDFNRFFLSHLTQIEDHPSKIGLFFPK